MGVVSLYRMIAKPSFGDFLRSVSGLTFVGASVGGILIAAVVGWWCYREWRSGSKRWVLSIMTNLIVVVSTFLAIEVTVRVAVEKRGLGEELGRRLLYPRQWDRVAATYLDLLKQARTRSTYLIYNTLPLETKQ